jgi:hypothetical protein
LGTETFSVLRNLRDNYNPKNANSKTIYEQYPLMYLALHDPNYSVMGVEDAVYNSDQELYEGLLNSAPICGPASNCGVTDWTSTSRCIWPQNLGKIPAAQDQTTVGAHTDFNGLDYMMLHNLYYIAFRKEDLTTLTINNIGIFNIPRRCFSQRSGFIVTSASILGNNVTYTATRSIILKNGFSATAIGGKSFVAKVQPLSNNYQGNAYKLLNVTDCQNSATISKAPKNNNLPNNDTESLVSIDQSTNENILIYPNPSRGFINLSVDHSTFPVNFDITNTNGVVVYKNQITSNQQIEDISALPKGLYLIRIYLKDKTNTKKIVLI